MTHRKNFAINKAPVPTAGARIIRPRMIGADCAINGTVEKVEGGYITVRWTDGRINVLPAQVVMAPGWRIAA